VFYLLLRTLPLLLWQWLQLYQWPQSSMAHKQQDTPQSFQQQWLEYLASCVSQTTEDINVSGGTVTATAEVLLWRPRTLTFAWCLRAYIVYNLRASVLFTTEDTDFVALTVSTAISVYSVVTGSKMYYSYSSSDVCGRPCFLCVTDDWGH